MNQPQLAFRILEVAMLALNLATGTVFAQSGPETTPEIVAKAAAAGVTIPPRDPFAATSVPSSSLNPTDTKADPVQGAIAPRQMEDLGRGVVAINQGGGKVFVSWRFIGTDPEDIAFNLYRATGSHAPAKLNREPLNKGACYQDTGVDLSQATAYFVRPVLNGQEQETSAPFRLPANASARLYLSIPLKTPAGYAPNDVSVGDLDGDGEYDLVVHQAGRGRDNSQRGMTDPPILEAYKLDGTFLWRINLGKNIREGAHYTQFMVYDLDGDGKAEVACKTADGTVDGTGKIIGNATADYRSAAGYVLDGLEYLTLFDGATGAELVTTPYLPPRGRVSEWGDDYGNRVDRFLACVAYLDGERPSLVMCRGYYTRAVLVAWNWRAKKLSRVWTFDSDDGTPANRAYRGQGNHNLSVPWQNVTYNQPTQPGFYLGQGMNAPPQPKIKTAKFE